MVQLFFCFFLLLPITIYSQFGSLKAKIEDIVSGKNSIVGIAVTGIKETDTLSLNSEAYFPMQSVFKFHIAIACLSEVDKGRLALDDEIEIKKEDLLPNTWSPIREKYPGGTKMTLAELIKYTISQSDNNGCDILLNLLGGTKNVNDYFKLKGFKDVSIIANEAEMHSDWDIQFKNRTTPKEATNLLIAFHNQTMLSKESNNFLFQTMAETQTGNNRIKGKLPAGTIVAHKTGSSGINSEGITAAVNDIGIVQLPDGKHFYIAVFITDSKESLDANENIISGITKLIWDYYTNQ